MRTTVKREKVLLILDWCVLKFGASKYNDEFPPRLRLYKSRGTGALKNIALRGTYLDGTICIYLGSITSYKELCETVIHEYKHYIMNDNEYDRLTEKLKKKGRDEDFFLYHHPHEKRARYAERKWGKICYGELRYRLYKR